MGSHGDGKPAMKRRTQAVLLGLGLAVATVVVSIVMLTAALARIVDPHHYCDAGFSRFIDCQYHWSSRTRGRSNPMFTNPSSPADATPPSSPDTFQPTSADITSWAVAQCPQNYMARRLLCAVPSAAAPVQAAIDDHDTGLPLPRPWLARTAKSSPFIEALHVETPLDLESTLGFYRAELSRRGWTEDGGALVEPERAVIAFMTSNGPALLRLVHQDGRTIADLSRRKPAAATADILPNAGQARLRLGNAMDEDAVITINTQTITLAARTGDRLTDDPETGRKSPDSPEIDLPPGRYKVALRIVSGAAESREFEIAAGETWGLVVGPAGIPLPVHLY